MAKLFRVYNGNAPILLWLLTRAVAVFLVSGTQPKLITDLYYPFVSDFIASPSLDPWAAWLLSGGPPDAFPYAWPMLIVLSAGVIIGSVFSLGWLSIFMMMLVLDFCVAVLVRFLSPERGRASGHTVWLYLTSPLPLVALVLTGSNDFLIMFLLVAAMIALKKNRPGYAGVLVGLAIGSKLILIVAVLSILVLLVKSTFSARAVFTFTLAAVFTATVVSSPLIYSYGFRQAVFLSDEATVPLRWSLDSPGDRKSVV